MPILMELQCLQKQRKQLISTEESPRQVGAGAGSGVW